MIKSKKKGQRAFGAAHLGLVSLIVGIVMIFGGYGRSPRASQDNVVTIVQGSLVPPERSGFVMVHYVEIVL